MIHHLVLFRLRADATPAQIDDAFRQLAGLKDKIPGILSFSGGAYSSPEGLHKGYTHGFAMTFTDAAARDAYLPHPEHEVVKKVVFALLDGGLDGVVAFDFEG
jgi:hypothetical protein